jgi:DNA-binding MarR family transcriptional regulator
VSIQTGTRAEVLEEVGRAFKGVGAAQRRLRAHYAHRPGELTYAQYGLLFGLYFGEPMSSRDLAAAADVSPATAAEMLDALTVSGLVQRVRSADDKRIVLTSLTERGRAVVEARRAQYEPRFRAALEGFSDEELRSAAGVLEALRQMFDDLAESEA